jgi:Na+-driven multidrug efflux pump
MEMKALAAQALRIVSVAQPALAILMILTGSLRGAGDSRWPLLLTFVGLLCIRIPLGIALAWNQITLPFLNMTFPLAGWGLQGAWYAMVVDLFVRTFLVIWRFRQGAWRRIVV